MSCFCQKLELDLLLKPKFSNPPPLFVFSVCLIHFTGGMFPVCTIDPIDPMNPMDPMNPIDPMNPVDPIDPID